MLIIASHQERLDQIAISAKDQWEKIDILGKEFGQDSERWVDPVLIKRNDQLSDNLQNISSRMSTLKDLMDSVQRKYEVVVENQSRLNQTNLTPASTASNPNS